MTEDHYSKDVIAADAREFATVLVDAHPDPYKGHGGRVPFNRRLEDLVQDVPADGESTIEVARRLQRFAARIRDGHTRIVIPDDERGGEGRLPIDVRVVGDALYIEAVYDDKHTELLGSRVRAVQDIPIPELRSRMARIQSSDNVFGDRKALCTALSSDPASLKALIDATPPTVTFETPGGEQIERELERIKEDTPTATIGDTLPHPQTSGEPAYRFHEDTALLTVPDCHSHRETFEAALKMRGTLPDFYDIQDTYRRLVGKSVPEATEEAVAGLPAATEVFAALVEEMAEKDTETLVIDTRGNGGGSSIAPYMLTYMLHGRDGVREAARDQYSVGKHSDLYRSQYGENGQLKETSNPEGFDFHDYHAYTGDDDPTILTELQAMSDVIADELDSNEHAGYYCPENVVVVTDARTFSAGVEIGILLSKLGADIVGVPSSQSPNGPRDVLTGELPETGLTYRVSYRQQVFQPDQSGDVFQCDVQLTPERFESYDRAGDAGLLLALDAAAADTPTPG